MNTVCRILSEKKYVLFKITLNSILFHLRYINV